MEAPRSDIIVLVPAYNEELTISMVVMLSKKYCDRVIVIDDGSHDRTVELATMAGAEVISQGRNSGKAAALMAGFKRCKELSPKCTVMLDGDGQMDPAQIPVVAAPVIKGEADLVIGSRFIGEGTRDIPKHRQLGQRLLNKATNAGSAATVTDSQSGYRALSLNALNNLNFSSEGFNIESDMIVHFSERGLKITEVPVNVRYDVPNGHKQDPLKHGMTVMGRVVSYIGYRRPLWVFGFPGIIAFVAGFIICLATFLEDRIVFDWTLVSQGIAGIVVFGVGVFLIFAALMLNSLGVLMRNLKASINDRN